MRDQSEQPSFISGLVIFILINLSLLFLVLSPVIPNPRGKHLDDRFLRDVDSRIKSARTGKIKLTLQFPNGSRPAHAKINFRQTGHEFIFGCNFFEFKTFKNAGENELYEQYFKRLFNLAVLPFYWSMYEPAPGKFPTVEKLDQAVDWCDRNQVLAKGHPLVWRNPAGYPKWLPNDRQKVTALLQARIEDTVSKFNGRVKMWDVVNEPTHLPSFGSQSRYDYVRNSLLRAHEKDPKAVLGINDYGILGHDFGRGFYFRLIEKLRAENAPLAYIGFEGHEPRTDWIPAREIWASLDSYSRLKVPIYITEITIPSGELPITNSWKKGMWTEQAQAEYLERFYKTCFSHPGVAGIIYWDMCDSASWVKNAGLIKKNWAPKPSYQMLDRLINHEWHSEGTGETDARGSFSFTGFYGTYEISLPDSGLRYIIFAHKSRDNSFVLNLPRPGNKK